MEPVYKQHVCIAQFQNKKEPTKKIVVEVYYSLGGMNYFQGRVDPRCYRLAVTPKEISVSDFEGRKVTQTVTTAFTGTWENLQNAKRYSENTLINLAKYALATQQYIGQLNHVLEKNNLKMEDYEREI